MAAVEDDVCNVCGCDPKFEGRKVWSPTDAVCYRPCQGTCPPV